MTSNNRSVSELSVYETLRRATDRDTLILIKDAGKNNRQAYVLVNNRLEGNAPLTVQALTDLSELTMPIESGSSNA